jgi:hypothetical protein
MHVLSVTKTSHSHKTWTEVSSSVPHFLQVGLLLNPIIFRCLLGVLSPVRRPATTLDCVLSKDSNRVFVARLGLEIHFRAYLRVVQGPSHVTKCWLSTQRSIQFLVLCLQTPRDGSGPTKFWIKLPLASFRQFHFVIPDDTTVQVHLQPCSTADTTVQLHPQPCSTADTTVQVHPQPCSTADTTVQVHPQPCSTADTTVQVHPQPAAQPILQCRYTRSPQHSRYNTAVHQLKLLYPRLPDCRKRIGFSKDATLRPLSFW